VFSKTTNQRIICQAVHVTQKIPDHLSAAKCELALSVHFLVDKSDAGEEI